MYTASTPALVAAVTAAGAFGLIGSGNAYQVQVNSVGLSKALTGFDSSEKIKQDIRSIREKLCLPADTPVPTGVGLLGWVLDKTEGSDKTNDSDKTKDPDDPRIPAILEELPAVIWFAFGTDLGKYVAQVRAYDSKRTHKHKTLVFVIVNSVKEALQAVNEWKVDAIVVQGG